MLLGYNEPIHLPIKVRTPSWPRAMDIITANIDTWPVANAKSFFVIFSFLDRISSHIGYTVEAMTKPTNTT